MLWQIFVILGLRTRTGIIVVVRSIPARLHRVLHQPITRRTSTSWYTSIESFSRRWLQFNSTSRILLKLCSRGWATRVSRRRRWWWWWYAICSRDIPTIQHPSTHYSHREESSSEWMKVRRHPPTHPWNPFLTLPFPLLGILFFSEISHYLYSLFCELLNWVWWMGNDTTLHSSQMGFFRKENLFKEIITHLNAPTRRGNNRLECSFQFPFMTRYDWPGSLTVSIPFNPGWTLASYCFRFLRGNGVHVHLLRVKGL